MVNMLTYEKQLDELIELTYHIDFQLDFSVCSGIILVQLILDKSDPVQELLINTSPECLPLLAKRLESILLLDFDHQYLNEHDYALLCLLYILHNTNEYYGQALSMRILDNPDVLSLWWSRYLAMHILRHAFKNAVKI